MPLQFDLVSPERRLASTEATEVQIPGADGDMTAMADHAPTITTLRPGIVTVAHAKGSDEYVVSGGFAEITGGQISVLAERAHARDEMTQDLYEEMVADFQAAYDAAKGNKDEPRENLPGPVDEAAKLLSDMVAVGGTIGLSPKQPNL